ncbi:ABC transporter ATP-binding protein [Tuberibacillus sp. Marseille-P3662]|uniref:ABC transporter ATP-binding protein n=1 Tax=Tuberibacillus sp. Marseille-P3662 TaxID=1965358 RepID=UPI000A1CA6A4|nr:ABC transporter ATP-binding protein [Tuberibacillus sp. Marseille-P3662]
MTLQINDVVKTFGDFTAVNHINLEIPEKQMFGLLGSNGAGKTTTFRMILGLLEPTEGTITWQGEPINYATSDVIGYLPEERGLYPKLKVRDQMLYLGRLRGMKKGDILEELAKWLDQFGVPEYMDKKVEELSKGNQQKIQFIAAVIHRPKLLILDEPFSGLDPVNVEVLKSAVVSLKEQGTSILFSSHRMEHVEELCEHVCILYRGEPVVHGALTEIKRSFGKKNVVVHADFDLSDLEQVPGVVTFRKTSQGAEMVVDDEAASQAIFNEVSGKGFVSKFELEEPSLNDIFIEKVGEAYA